MSNPILKFTTADESLRSTYSCRSEGQPRRSLGFASVEIREYSRTVGDNPSCSSGPPVSISWEYNVVGEISLDDYEDTRPPRRSHFEMVLPRKVRQDMLKREWDISQKEIAEAVRRNVKVKNQRKATVNNLDKATKMEEIMESAGRKFGRMLTFKKSVSKQVKEMEKKIDETNQARQQQMLEIDMADEYLAETVPDADESSSSSS